MGARIRRMKYTAIADIIDLVLRTTPILDGHAAPPAFINYAGGGDFMAVGDQLVARLQDRCGLRDGERVLDIGCGIGRAAVALQRGVPHIEYDGFDLVRYGITWCRKRFRGHPRFRFVHADIHNAFYNPRGTIAAVDYRFPCPDGSVDLAFATSVFTHMRAAEVRRYLGEIRRCLAPDGRAYVTCFVLDEDARVAIGAGRSRFSFGHRLGDAWAESSAEPELAVALDPAALAGDLEVAGLEVAAFHPGAWRGIQAAELQDAYVLRPRGRGGLGA